jgi:hypothetical protein
MDDLSYIFGLDPADRPERLSRCLISKIMRENSKQPDGARLWWQSIGDRLWADGLRGRASESYVWATEEDAAKAQAYGDLAPDEQLALVRRQSLEFFLPLNNADRNAAVSSTGSNLRATGSSTRFVEIRWSRRIARKCSNHFCNACHNPDFLSSSHCTVCNECVDWREWHCKLWCVVR